MKTENEKQLLIEQLKKTPVVQVACEKIGIGRATFYRWKNTDEKFAIAVNEAISDGNGLVNDMAESQLMSAIKDKNLTAIIFWLRNHHPSYATRVEVTAKLKHDEELTPEQEELVMKALKLASILPSALPTNSNEEKDQ